MIRFLVPIPLSTTANPKNSFSPYKTLILICIFLFAPHVTFAIQSATSICESTGNIPIPSINLLKPLTDAEPPATTTPTTPSSPSTEEEIKAPGSSTGITESGGITLSIGASTVDSGGDTPSSSGSQSTATDPTSPASAAYIPGTGGSGGSITLYIPGAGFINVPTGPASPAPPPTAPGGGGAGGGCQTGCTPSCTPPEICSNIGGGTCACINLNPSSGGGCTVPPDQCENNSQCDEDKKCSSCSCVSCSQGAGDACEEDSDCGNNQSCKNCECVDNPPPTPTIEPTVYPTSQEIKSEEDPIKLDRGSPQPISSTVYSLDVYNWAIKAAQNPQSAGRWPNNSSMTSPIYDPINPPNRGGEWFYSLHYPVILWNYLPTADDEELIGYMPDSRRFIFGSRPDGQLILMAIDDTFGNRTSFNYNYSGTTLEEKRFGGVKERYVRTGNLLTISRQACHLDYTNCSLLPALDESLLYDSFGRLISYTGPESIFAPDPDSLSSLYKINNITKNRLSYSLTYNPVGLLTKIDLTRPSGESLNVATIGWVQNGIIWRINTVTSPVKTGMNNIFQVSYPQSNQIRVEDGYLRSSYTYDPAGHLSQIVKVPLLNTQATTAVPSKTWSYEYLAPSLPSCPLVSRVVYPSNSFWDGSYDYLLRLVKVTKTSPLNDNDTVTREFNYGTYLTGNPINWIKDETGNYTYFDYQWENQIVDPLDARGRPIYNAARRDVTVLNGSTDTLTEEITYLNDGRIDTKSTISGVINQYFYENTGQGSGRNLLLSTAVGPDNGLGKVDTNHPTTTFARLERNHKAGFVTSLIEGPVNDEVRTDYILDSIGRVREVREGDQLSRYYYNWLGKQVTELRSSVGLLSPSSGSGGSSGNPILTTLPTLSTQQKVGAWYRTDKVYAYGLLRATLSDLSRKPTIPHDWSSLEHFQLTSYDYSTNRTLLSVTDYLGDKLIYDWNGYGELYRITHDGGAKLLEHIKNPNGFTASILARDVGGLEYSDIHYIQNKVGKLTEIKFPNGRRRELHYDPAGNPTGTKLFSNSTLLVDRSWELDEAGRTVRNFVRNPNTGEIKTVKGIHFGHSGPLAVYDHFNSLALSIQYDAANRVKKISKPGEWSSFQYYPNRDDIFHVSKSAAPGDVQHAEFEYDALRRVSSINLLGDGASSPIQSIDYIYDKLGFLKRINYPEGSYVEREMSPDGFQWSVKINDSLVGRATRIIDTIAHKKTVELIDAGNRKTKIISGLKGIESITYPGDAPITFSYNGAYKLASINRATTTLMYEYDSMGRPEKLSAVPVGAGNSIIRKFIRDTLDRVEKIEVQDGAAITTTEYTFDEFNGIESELTASSTVGARTTYFDRNTPSGYDFSKIHNVDINGTTWQNIYDQTSGLVTDVKLLNPPTGIPQDVASFEYNGVTTSKISTFSGLENIIDYDSFGRLQSTLTKFDNLSVDRTVYGYDSLSRISQIERHLSAPFPTQSGTTLLYGSAFSYDNQSRLESRKDGVLSISEYTKDFKDILAASETNFTYQSTVPGLRESVATTGIVDEDKSYTLDQTRGRYSSMNGSMITYDGDGRITSNGESRFTYDTLGRLTKIQNNLGVTLATFEYDALDRLIRTQSSQGTEINRWVGSRVYATEETSGALNSLNIWYPYVLNERLLTFKKEGSSFVPYHTSWANYSPTATFDSDDLKEAYAYGNDGEVWVIPVTPQGFGALQSSSTINQELGYHGMTTIAGTSLYYVRNRWFDSRLGTFTERDPLSPWSYEFASNNPINATDPLGLQTAYQSTQEAGFLRSMWNTGTEWLSWQAFSFCMTHPEEAALLADIADGLVKEVRDEIETIVTVNKIGQAILDVSINETAAGKWVKENAGELLGAFNQVTPLEGSYDNFDKIADPWLIGVDMVRDEISDHAEHGFTTGDVITVGGLCAGWAVKGSATVARTSGRYLDDIIPSRTPGRSLSGGLSTKTPSTAGVAITAREAATVTSGVAATAPVSQVCSNVTKSLPIFRISRKRLPAIAENIDCAIKSGHPNVLTKRATRLDGLSKDIPVIDYPNFHRDEYPFAITEEGGFGCWIGHVPAYENMSAGNMLKQFFKKNKIKAGDQFIVEIVDE